MASLERPANKPSEYARIYSGIVQQGLNSALHTKSKESPNGITLQVRNPATALALESRACLSVIERGHLVDRQQLRGSLCAPTVGNFPGVKTLCKLYTLQVLRTRL